MQLNISELDDNFTSFSSEAYTNEYDNDQFGSQLEYEKIPENTVPAPIKVIKKGVHFADNTSFPQKPTHQSIPKVNAKITRPQMPQQKPKISYEDILSKMGMFVSDGKLHLVDRNTLTPQKQQELLNVQRQNQTQQQYQLQQEYQPQQYQPQQYQPQQYQQPKHSMDDTNIPKNSYIYNKYFKDEVQTQNNVRRPRSLHEYRMMLVDDYLEKQRIKQMKSTKLVMPTSNINIAAGHSANLNKLFSFSKR
jgi:hypothetical protein